MSSGRPWRDCLTEGNRLETENAGPGSRDESGATQAAYKAIDQGVGETLPECGFSRISITDSF